MRAGRWRRVRIDMSLRAGALLATAALAAALTGTALAGPAPGPAKPAASKREPPPGLPLPPEDSGETGEPEPAEPGAADGDEFGDPPPMSPQQRLQEFDLHISRAQRAERENRIDDAVREYTAALKLQPGDPAALKGRAYLRHKRTKDGQCPKRAIEDLRLLRTYDPRGLWLEQRGTLVAWLGQCDERMDAERLSLALEVADDDPKSPNRPEDVRYTIALLQSREAEAAERDRERLALRRAALQQLDLYRKDCEVTGRKPVAEALSLQATLYREAEDREAAIQIYEDLIRRYPGTAPATQAKKNLDELKLEVELDKLEKEQGGKPSQLAEEAYTAAGAALRAGDIILAERELSRAIEDSPWFPKAHYLLGIIYARSGRFPQAAEQLKISIRMDRFDYEAHMVLGMLYKKEFAGAEDEQAIKHLETALLLRPDLYHLEFQLGQLYARIDREKARRHYTRFLNAPIPDDDPDRELARRARDELNREPSTEEAPFSTEPPRDLQRLEPELQRMINEAYLRVAEEQDLRQAERVLERARKKFPREEIVLNELAKVAYALDRRGDAREFWEKSLAMKADQMEVHERLGLLLEADLPD